MRSSSVNPFGSFHNATSSAMLISLGIQWLAHASKYFCQAHLYLKGTNWFKSARQLMIFLSSTRMRAAPISNSKPTAPLSIALVDIICFLLSVRYWHASQVGSVIKHALGSVVTAFNARLSTVAFSVFVAPMLRK